MFELQSIIVCPACGHKETERMHEDAQQVFYKCKGCAKVLRPIKGDCCVFCSFGDAPCPTTQMHTGRRENVAGAPSWFLIKEEAAAPV